MELRVLAWISRACANWPIVCKKRTTNWCGRNHTWKAKFRRNWGLKRLSVRVRPCATCLKKARVVAPTDSTCLLLGETGTGKELVARAVHALSSRHAKTFIKLNCAAVPSGLLESELFGHEKGAFTGAVSQKVGRIELADKGTLFLDEIGELPLELQPKLLRVLQDREFERLGGVHTLHVDVRIISATNRDLQQDIADKKFREDLFYRLNVFPIQLPALRERRADIPILVHHFVRKHSGRMGKHIETIPDETMEVLQNWIWPGNIRELENMIERMVIMTKGSDPGSAARGIGCAAGDWQTTISRKWNGSTSCEFCGRPTECCQGRMGRPAGWGSSARRCNRCSSASESNCEDYRRGSRDVRHAN